MTLSLRYALRINDVPCIAFTGAGGKTTAMFQLARQLHPPVIITAATHLGAWQIELADKHIVAESPTQLEELESDLNGVLLVAGELDEGKTKPINPNVMDWLSRFCKNHSVPLLVEADGSRQKPLKAWAEHEPPIPEFVEQVVHVAGLSGLGKPLNEDHVHRPEIFSKLSGLKIGESIAQDHLIKVLMHPEGGLKNIPINARRVILLNQADTPELQSAAHGMSHTLLSSFHSVIVSSAGQEKILAVHEPTAGIVLAAGESSRFGQPKQLLDWKGEPFVRAVARTALDAGLSPVIVVTGANAKKVEAAVGDLNVVVVRNNEWKSGQGSSIKKGVLALPPPSLPQIQHENSGSLPKISDVVFGGSTRRAEGVGGAIFLLTDQPQVTPSILRALREKHAEGLHPVVAPMVMDRRANPVLFDRVTFPDLMTLEGDIGGRAIFHKHRVEYLPWHDDSLLLDVDTPEQYQRLVSNGDL
jgi:molybdenum cofactor cytidylyltransferase